IEGVSPTSFPACGCSIWTGGGPQPPPPGGPAPSGPPPLGYPPPPPGIPPPGNPLPLGYPLAGLSSWGSWIGGSSGSCSGPPLGGLALSGPTAHQSAASSSTMLAIHLVQCPVCGLMSSTISLLR